MQIPFKIPRFIKRKIHRAKLNGIELSIKDCLPLPKPISPLKKTYKLLNDYFEVIRITNMINGANGKYIPSELEKRVIKWCQEQMMFIKKEIDFNQKRVAKWRLTNIVDKLKENSMVNKKLLDDLNYIRKNKNE